MSESIYFKVYQDRDSMDCSYYVETKEGIENSLIHWKDCALDGEPFPVIEPVIMSDDDFNLLPEFQGY